MIGTHVGSYRILSEIGAGGMGVVYLAEDPRLNRRVALKFIRTDLARSANADARLVHEARAASALDHPNIATIYEIGEWQGGHFIAMAWYDGETLADRLTRGPLSVDDAVPLLDQLATGLARAHAAGIVHRDLKPGNIMLTKDGVVKILDFGLASYSPSDTETEARLTQTGSTMGTAAYMSPEQVQGGVVDVRSDIWALGVIAYELLAGRRPFTGPHLAAVVHAIQYESPAPLSGVPAPIEALVTKSLQRDPRDRPQTVSEFAAALHRWQASKATAGPETVRAGRLRPVVVIPALLAVAAASYFGATAWNRSMQARWARDVALPEASRLIDAERVIEAFDLVSRVSVILPDNAIAAELAAAVSTTIPISSDPPGATVSYQPYLEPDAAWTAVGVTPIQAATVPASYLRWRFEKPGFTTVELARSMGREPAVPRATSVNVELTSTDLAHPGMVLVPAESGSFRLILPGFEHLGFASIGAFWIDRFEVTNAEFKQFVDAGGYRREEFWREPFVVDGRTIPWREAVARFVDSTGQPGPATWIQAEFPAAESALPVTGVSWYEAAAYARFAGKALPTMSHWAQAAEPRGARWVTQLANLAGKSPVSGGTRRAMHWSGAFDLAGNVKEWVSTDSGDGRRYILGGGWDDPLYAFNDPDSRDPFERGRTFGFRCVRYVTPPDPAFLAPIPMVTRDYKRERPATGSVFDIYRRQYMYDHGPLDPAVAVSSEDSADWRREDVTIPSASGNGTMRVFVFIPKRGAPPYQAVLVIPGADALQVPDIDQFPRRTIDFLAKSGRVVVLPELQGMFARSTGLRDSTANTSARYRDHFIAWVKDSSRAIDYLATRSDLAMPTLGYVGFSWGARMGTVISALDSRVRVQVLINGGLSLQPAQPEVDQLNFVSHVTIPTLMLNGRSDFYFPVESSQRPMFDLLGTPTALKERRLYDGGHNIPRAEMIKETLAWLDRFQGRGGK